MQADIFEIIKAQMNALGIQVLFYSDGQDSFQGMDFGLRGQLFSGYSYENLCGRMGEYASAGSAIHMRDAFFAWYTLLELPSKISAEYQFTYCLIGPVLFQAPDEEMRKNIMDNYRIPLTFSRCLLEYYNRIPVLDSLDMWCSLIQALLGFVPGEKREYRIEEEFEHIDSAAEYSQMKLKLKSDENYNVAAAKPDSESLTFDSLEARYQAEEEMLLAVAAGNVGKTLEAFHQFIQFKLTPRTPNPIRNRKNLLLTMNTLCRKAVQSAQVHPYYIDEVSTRMAVEIEKAADATALNAMGYRMIRKYCALVNQFSRRGYSMPVQKCLNYIEINYESELSLRVLADMCGVSAGYLSAQFKRETGFTVTEYINQTRIRQSLKLLNESAMSVCEVAIQCGFQDANYYTRMFKRYYHITPTQYRKREGA